MEGLTEKISVQEMDLFEGAARTSGRGRRLSEEDLESLRSGTHRYKRRTDSRLSALLRSGSFQSIQQQQDDDDANDDNDEETRDMQIEDADETKELLLPKQQQNVVQTSSEQKEEIISIPTTIITTTTTTASTTTTPPVTRKPERRHVSFVPHVHVHFHEMILGYNPAVSSGAPVELAWNKFDEQEQSVSDRYSPPMPKLKISEGLRMRICLSSGSTVVDVMSRVEAIDILRQQQVASIKMAKMEERKAAKAAAKQAKAQSKAANKSSSTSRSGGECCVIL